MRMVRWASVTPEHFLIHVRGAIHAIKKMDLDTKFQEAMKAVESAILEVDLTKMQYKDELKKREKDDSSQQAVGASKASSDKAKKSKKAEGDESPPAKVVAAEAALKVRIAALSERQREVMMLLVEGLSNKEIARRLGISPETVKTHLARLYERLGARRRRPDRRRRAHPHPVRGRPQPRRLAHGAGERGYRTRSRGGEQSRDRR